MFKNCNDILIFSMYVKLFMITQMNYVCSPLDFFMHWQNTVMHVVSVLYIYRSCMYICKLYLEKCELYPTWIREFLLYILFFEFFLRYIHVPCISVVFYTGTCSLGLCQLQTRTHWLSPYSPYREISTALYRVRAVRDWPTR